VEFEGSHTIIAEALPSLLLQQEQVSLSLGYKTDLNSQAVLYELHEDDFADKHHVLLHFDKITGKGSPPIVEVYLNPEAKEFPSSEYHAGTLALYGLEESSTPSAHHDGKGMEQTLDITNLLQSFHRTGDRTLTIILVPETTGKPENPIIIGEVRLTLINRT